MALSATCSVALLTALSATSRRQGGGLTTCHVVALTASYLLTFVAFAAPRKRLKGAHKLPELVERSAAAACLGIAYIAWATDFAGLAIWLGDEQKTVVQVVGLPSWAGYLVFVEVLQSWGGPALWRPLLSLETLHNVGLSALSAAMLVGITVSCWRSDKLAGPYAFLCGSFEEDRLFEVTALAFFWSKFWEWGDSALLLAKGKGLSWLHYTHHASTAFLTALNVVTPGKAVWGVVCGLNSFVHMWMYAYYVQPRALRWSKKMLTQAQILQHVAVLSTAIYVLWVRYGLGWEDCSSDWIPITFGIAMYAMYLVFFLAFYVGSYLRRKPKPE